MVDTSALGDPRDVMVDMIVDLKRTKTKTFYFNMENEMLEKTDIVSYDYKICRYIYRHTIYKDFHKIIIAVTDKNGTRLALVFIQYYFDDKEHSVETDDNKGKRKTFFSVKKGMKDLSAEGKKPKDVFHSMVKQSGSFENARTVGDIPTRYKQDDLIEILDMCNKQKEGN